MSYAEVAATGPRQSREEAAAPQLPQVVTDESIPTVSLIDVDAPSVVSVPADFSEQDIKTETQKERKDREYREERVRTERDHANNHSGKGGSVGHRVPETFLGRILGSSPSGASSVGVMNLVAVIGIGSFLGYKGLTLFQRGELTWSKVGLGAGLAIGVGLFQAGLAKYVRWREECLDVSSAGALLM